MAGIDYEDDRFQQVENDKNAAISESEKLYGDMVDKSDKYFQDQIDAAKDWSDKQQQNQQDRTDFTIEQIEQNKDQAHKDYLKEQSGAYKDWQKQSNAYGANAEQMAANGLAGTGYSESSQVGMYNTYQNRVAMARESYGKAILNYDNAIKDAQLQNNSALAQIAYEALQKELELSLQGFQYKNNLLLEQANRKQELDNIYHGRYQDVLNQINHENSVAEDIRRYNENLKLQKEQFAYEKTQNERNYQLQLKQLAEEKRQFDAKTGYFGDSGYPTIKDGNTSKNELNTEYYSGSLNSDCKKYGTFSNGYQPKGIDGYGKVSKTGKTVQLSTQTLAGQNKTVVQNVWQTSDGTKWYWDGRYNKYIKMPNSKNTLKGSVGSALNEALRR